MTISPTIDHSLMLALNGDLGAFTDQIMWILSSKAACAPLVIYALWIAYKHGSIKNMATCVVVIALMILFADQVSQLFKYNLSRLRPTHEPMLEGAIHTVNNYKGGLYGTVSAHAANSFSVILFCAWIVRQQWFIITGIVLCLAICYSRIYLGVHFPLDILWGTLLGFTTAIGGIKLKQYADKILHNR
ncbi:MAG: phosphatase PAP2 family protein [Rikenellaceae bacterium]